MAKHPVNVKNSIRLIGGKNTDKNISTHCEKTENTCIHKIVTKPVMEILQSDYFHGTLFLVENPSH